MPVWAGNTFRRIFVFKDGAGDPLDISGSKLVFRCSSATGVIRKDTDDGTGFTITDAVNGTAELILEVEDTRSLPAGEVRYEIELWSGTEQLSLLFGVLNVTVWVNDDVDP